MRIKLTIQFIGTAFCGWQLQNNGRTVQGVLEDALLSLYGVPIRVTGVGRTDEGVHARRFVAHYDAEKSMPCAKIVSGLNRFLPADVSALLAELACDDFDARKSAKSKTYLYRIYVSPSRQAFLDGDHLQIYEMPDIELMRQGAELLVGTHDFVAFAKVGGNVKTTVRTVYGIDIKVEQNRIDIYVRGNAFLYNMVRNIVGCLLFLTQGKLGLSDIAQMVEEGRRTVHFKTVSGRGLQLYDVDY